MRQKVQMRATAAVGTLGMFDDEGDFLGMLWFATKVSLLARRRIKKMRSVYTFDAPRALAQKSAESTGGARW